MLELNARGGRNEIDLVVRRGRTVVFCEVKSKSGSALGTPLEMVDDEKQRRVRRAAIAWLARHPELRDLDVRFDVIVDSDGKLHRVPAAF